MHCNATMNNVHETNGGGFPGEKTRACILDARSIMKLRGASLKNQMRDNHDSLIPQETSRLSIGDMSSINPF